MRGQLTDEDRKQIVVYRIEKAERTFKEAQGAIANGFAETAANRLYYAAYYAVSALLIAHKHEASTHNGVIQIFGMTFLKTNIIDKKHGRTYNRLFSLRLTGDYEDRYVVDMETEVLPLVGPAKELIDLTCGMAKEVLCALGGQQ